MRSKQTDLCSNPGFITFSFITQLSGVCLCRLGHRDA